MSGPLFVNQKAAAKMIGVTEAEFRQIKNLDHRLMPAVIPKIGKERYLVSDLEAWAKLVKYPQKNGSEAGEMWGDESSA